MSALLDHHGAGPPRSEVSVLVVDDQRAVRENLARLISCGVSPLRSVTTASNGAEALALAAHLHPELVVLDVDLGGEDGLHLLPQLTKTARVVVLTSHGDMRTRARARLLGAHAFVEKHEPASALLAAIVELAFPRAQGEACPTSSGDGSHGETGPSSAAPRQGRP